MTSALLALFTPPSLGPRLGYHSKDRARPLALRHRPPSPKKHGKKKRSTIPGALCKIDSDMNHISGCMWTCQRHLAPALFGLLVGIPNRSPSAVLEGSHAPFGGAAVLGRGGGLRPLALRAAAAALFSAAFLASCILLSGSRTCGATGGGEYTRLEGSSHRGLLGRICPACSRAGMGLMKTVRCSDTVIKLSR